MALLDDVRNLIEREQAVAKELRERLTAVKAEGSAIQEKLDVIEAQIADLENMILTSEHRHNTVSDVNTNFSANALRSQAQMAEQAKQNRLVLVMAKRGLSFGDVAEALTAKLKRKVPRSTVQSWVKPKGDVAYRAIPQDAADALKALYGVPSNAWGRIIPGT